MPLPRPVCLVCFGEGRPFLPELAARLTSEFEVYRFNLAAGKVYRGEVLMDERLRRERHFTALSTLYRHRRLLARAVVHYHFVHPVYILAKAFCAPGRSIAQFWGSDVYRVGPVRHSVHRSFLQDIARVAAPSEVAARAVAERYRRSEVAVWQFGIGSFDGLRAAIEQATAPISKDTICIGYNGFREQQHLRILTAAEAGLRQLQGRYRIVLPMTYGATAEYLAEVRGAYAAAGLSVEILTDFIPEADLLSLRLRTALMLHFPVSDAFSASMQEVLVAGGSVLAGDWLTYAELAGTGAPIWHLSWTELGRAVRDIAAAQDGDHAAARAPIAELPREARLLRPLLDRSSWAACLPKYQRAYRDLGA